MPPQPRQIKSAPPWRQRTRTSATTDIEDWVYSNKDLVNGKSTEQRLLRAKLLELGKERFKLKTKLSYDIQKFVDRQTKSGLLNGKKTRPMSATVMPSVSVTTNITPLKKQRSALCQSAPASRVRTQVPKATKSVQFVPSVNKCNYLSTGLTDEKDEEKLLDHIEKNGTFSSEIPKPEVTVSVPKIRSPPRSAVQLTRQATPAATPIVPRRNAISAFSIADSIRESRFSKFGAKFPSVAKDPRFSRLHTSLSDNYESKIKDNVYNIIQRKESLRSPLKSGSKEARRELEIKIKIFMDENNIVF